MNSLSQEQSQKISNLVREVEKLNDVERLLLYLQLPCGQAELPEGNKYRNNTGSAAGAPKQSTDIFSKKSDQETTQTYTWILSHLEEDPNVSLPKQEVYDEYRAFCQANRFEPLCVADFGKAMKHALPCIKPRRLGQRGNSRYCYSGLRKKYKLEAPSLPDMMSNCDLQGSPSMSTCSPLVAEHHYPNGQGGSGAGAATTRRAKSVAGFGDSGCQFVDCSPASNCAASSSGMSSCSTRTNNGHGKIIKMELCTSNQSHCLGPSLVPDCCGGAAVAAPSAAGMGAAACSGLPSHVVPDQYQQQQQQQQQQHHHHHHQHQAAQVQPAQAPLTSHQIAQQPVAPHNHYQQSAYVHRCGTPDDDDYRHNYHDLNRPIVGPAVIPFSQSIHAQMAQQPAPHNSFLSYNNPLPPPPMNHHTPSHHQQQDQQHVVNAKQHCIHQRQHQSLTSACCREPSKANGNNNNNNIGAEATRSTSTQQLDQSSASIQAHQQFVPTSNGTIINNNHDQQQIAMEPPRHHHQPQQADTPQLPHFSLSLLDHCASSSMEYCTSPFQSPASTPYPNMGAYSTAAAAQGASQDYFSTDCQPSQY